MKRFRRVLSVAVTLALIVTLLGDNLYAAFVSSGGGTNRTSVEASDSLIADSQPNTDETVGIEGEDGDIPSDDAEVPDNPEISEDSDVPGDSESPEAPDAGDSDVMDNPQDGDSLGSGDEEPGSDLPQGDPSDSDPSDDDLLGDAPSDDDQSDDDVLDDDAQDSEGEEDETSPQDNPADIGAPDTKVTVNGEEIQPGDPPTELSGGETVIVDFSWTFDAKDLRNAYYEYEFENSFFECPMSGPLVNNGIRIGSFRFVEGENGKTKLIMEFDGNAGNVIGIDINFEAIIPSGTKEYQNEEEFREQLGDKTFDFKWKDDTSSLSTDKEATSRFDLVEINEEDGTYKFKRTFQIETTVEGQAYDLKISDIVDQGQARQRWLDNFNVIYEPAVRMIRIG